MSRGCEVCTNLSATGGGPRAKSDSIRRLLIGERIIALCDEHAAEVDMNDAASLEQVRELFGEPDGKRSLLARRSPLDRRVFPPRPEGRRRSDGRRRTDDRD